MTSATLRGAVLGAAFVVSLASAAHATSVGRTFVSGAGSDANTANNCTVVNPCRSFAAAYGITSAGGEIVALDAAGYGGLTITGAISIIAPLGASLGAAASSAAITVNAGAGHLVLLKGLEINGNNLSSTTGIVFNSGRLFVEQSTLKQLTVGISVAANTKADLFDTKIIGNNVGISTIGTGTSPNAFFTSPLALGPTQVRVYGGSITDNTTAFSMANPGVDGSSNVQSTPLPLVIIVPKSPAAT